MTPFHVIAGLTVIAGIGGRGPVGRLLGKPRKRSVVGAAGVAPTTAQRINYYQKNYKALNDQFPTSGQNGKEMRATLQARQFWWAYLREGASSQQAVDNALQIYKQYKGKDPRVLTAFRTLAQLDRWILQTK